MMPFKQTRKISTIKSILKKVLPNVLSHLVESYAIGESLIVDQITRCCIEGDIEELKTLITPNAIIYQGPKVTIEASTMSYISFQYSHIDICRLLDSYSGVRATSQIPHTKKGIEYAIQEYSKEDLLALINRCDGPFFDIVLRKLVDVYSWYDPAVINSIYHKNINSGNISIFVNLVDCFPTHDIDLIYGEVAGNGDIMTVINFERLGYQYHLCEYNNCKSRIVSDYHFCHKHGQSYEDRVSLIISNRYKEVMKEVVKDVWIDHLSYTLRDNTGSPSYRIADPIKDIFKSYGIKEEYDYAPWEHNKSLTLISSDGYINNFLFDKATGKYLGVAEYDTILPFTEGQLVLVDFLQRCDRMNLCLTG